VGTLSLPAPCPLAIVWLHRPRSHRWWRRASGLPQIHRGNPPGDIRPLHQRACVA